jgi:protein involved in polysaccharide export with SLBB domain
MERITLKNLIRTAGGIQSQAYDEGKIVRYTYKDKKWVTSSIDFSLSQINQKDSSDIELDPLDRVIINQKSDFFQTDWKVGISGEVNYPGTYPIGGGTRISEAIVYAGLLKENADLSGLVLIRGEAKGIQTKNQKQAEELLKKDMLKISSGVRDAYLSTEERLDNKQSVSIIQEYLSRLENKEVQGRVLLNEEDLLSLETFKGSTSDIFLQDDDSIYIPEKKTMITIVGEVYIPASYLYRENDILSDYLEQAGGVSSYADFESAYIIRTNGSVVSYAQKGRKLKSMKMRPGDVVIIPSKVLGVSRK